MDLAASTPVLFLLSTTPLICCGVYGSEKLWLIPFHTKNLFKSRLVNYVRLSLLIRLTGSFIWSSISLTKLIKICGVFDLSLSKKTQVKRVKSSTMTIIYFLWLRLATFDESRRSIWRSSRGSMIEESTIWGWIPLVCLPDSCTGHKVSLLNFMLGSARTNSPVTKLLIYLKLRSASFWCYSQLTSDTCFDRKHNYSLPMIRERSNGYIVHSALDLIKHMFPSLVMI